MSKFFFEVYVLRLVNEACHFLNLKQNLSGSVLSYFLDSTNNQAGTFS